MSACNRLKHRVNPAATVEEPGELLTRIDMSDAKAERQIRYGFYPVEQGAWRWTKRKFGVTLRPPRAASLEGAKLEMQVALPEASAALWKHLSITAKVQGRKLTPMILPGAGEHIFSARVPKAMLQGDAADVEFELSDVAPAGKIDGRELGVIVTAIWFAEP